MELLVIGGGPGGYVAAIWAAKKGANVTLVEKDAVGGTCLNRGCIPTKAILHSANLFHEAKHFAELGIEISAPTLDYAAVAKRRDKIVAQLRGGVELLLQKAGVTVVRGEARFLSRGEVAVKTAEGETVLPAQNVIIAAGGAPADVPFAPADGADVLNSDHALGLETLPKSMAVIGGGVVGCEFAQAFARMGVKVTVLELLPALVANMEREQSELLLRALKRDGVDVHLSCKVAGVEKDANGVNVRFTEQDGTEKSVAAEKMLVAAGRKAATPALCAQAAGVAVDARGNIPVDGGCRTNVAGIYAIGDVTGGAQLAHVASHQGIVAVENLFGAQKELDERIIPYCVYTSPELASMGYTEAKAREAGLDAKTGAFPAAANGRAMIEGARDGFSKLVTDADGTVLGVHLAGPNVTEMISPLAGVVKFEATAEDVAEMIFAHPSVSEMIHESALDVEKKAIHKV